MYMYMYLPDQSGYQVLRVMDHLEYLDGSVRGARGQPLPIVIHLSIMLERRRGGERESSSHGRGREVGSGAGRW